jgi:tRNA acetyltransferase TAN1
MTRANTIDLHVQNICGVSVVGSDFDKLKKYNLAEIFEPTPKPAAAPSLSDPEAKEG